MLGVSTVWDELEAANAAIKQLQEDKERLLLMEEHAVQSFNKLTRKYEVMEQQLERQEAYYIGERAQLAELREAAKEAYNVWSPEPPGSYHYSSLDRGAWEALGAALLKQGGE